jgi:hypothetical protein
MLGFRFFKSYYGCTCGYKKQFAYGSGRAALVSLMSRCTQFRDLFFCCTISTVALNNVLNSLLTLDPWPRRQESGLSRFLYRTLRYWTMKYLPLCSREPKFYAALANLQPGTRERKLKRQAGLSAYCAAKDSRSSAPPLNAIFNFFPNLARTSPPITPFFRLSIYL